MKLLFLEDLKILMIIRESYLKGRVIYYRIILKNRFLELIF